MTGLYSYFSSRKSASKIVDRGGRKAGFDGENVFVNERRVHEWVVPGKMALHPAAYDRRELADLEAEASIFPWRDAQGIFVESDLRTVVRRIEVAIDADLAEKVNRWSDLRVDEEASDAG